jgi:uncharacterized protein (TIGR02246 family)
LLVLGCGGDAGETEAVVEETAAREMSAEEADLAAVDALASAFEEHYNMGHASMVADLHTDEALRLMANGGIYSGRDGILASLEAAVAGSPSLTINRGDTKVIGDHAVSHGTWAVEVTSESGEAITQSGSYMSHARRVDGEWKIGLSLTNYDAPPPEGFEFEPPPGDGPPEDLVDGPVADIVEYYQTHYNMGHASMVADLFVDDGVAAFPMSPAATGREGVEALIAQGTEAGDQITIHDVNTEDLGDGYYLDLGWYEMEAGDTETWGTYIVLAHRAEDGTGKIVWAASNGGFPPAEEG